MMNLRELPVVLLTILALPNLAIANPPLSKTPNKSLETRTVNGVVDERSSPTAFVNGTLVLAAGDVRTGHTLLIRDGAVEGVIQSEDNNRAPDGYRVVDLKGGYVYPGFIDYYTNLGMPEVSSRTASRFSGPEVLKSTDTFATNANEAIKSHLRGSELFRADTGDAKRYRENGFTTVLSFQPDGIARGTSVAVLTDDSASNDAILSEAVATHHSFDKGSSKQFYPTSRMGTVALLRQTYLDAQWFAAQEQKPFVDVSLSGWVASAGLPKVMSAFDWKTVLLADSIGDEFGYQYVIKGGGDEYQRLDLIKETQATMIVGVNFPKAPDVADPLLSGKVSLRQLKHWELAPYNLARLEQAAIPFVITAKDSGEQFWPNLKAAVKNGLSEDAALRALTQTPAKMMALEGQLGSLQKDHMANFVITNGPLFDEESKILSTWVRGQRFEVSPTQQLEEGVYELVVSNSSGAQSSAIEITQKKTKFKAKLVDEQKQKGQIRLAVKDDYLSFVFERDGAATLASLWLNADQANVDEPVWQGTGMGPEGESVQVTLKLTGALAADESSEDDGDSQPGAVIYPFVAHGTEQLPVAETLLIQNATVWTNESVGILQNADVLVKDGKIAQVGSDISAGNARVIDGTGLHLTPGIIDEHSHIALDGVNDFATDSSMVRMGDVVDSEDIGIYRDLAGGVTAAQLLHGSANPIGGQSAIIKMRWGQSPQDMLIEGADPFIKFALGENVKRSSNKDSRRYPQTRMGVEQFYVNAFNEAQLYEKQWQSYHALSRRERKTAVQPRRDLGKEALVEILNAKRFVTSHSYVQSEINMLMHVAEQFDFRINTFTHILEGYKVADKMAAHGVGGSTFSDWWAYKWEVRYAIPYNAAIMHQAGVVTAINSDDAEMSRRLNQEAAKSIRHGGLSEEDALKLVTLNPAKLLHLDDRMGSVKEGKDADLVLWSDHPLSIYSKPLTTLVDGIVYFDRQRDAVLQREVKSERNRLVQKILNDGDATSNGTAPPDPEKLNYHHHQVDEMADILLGGTQEADHE